MFKFKIILFLFGNGAIDEWTNVSSRSNTNIFLSIIFGPLLFGKSSILFVLLLLLFLSLKKIFASLLFNFKISKLIFEFIGLKIFVV